MRSKFNGNQIWINLPLGPRLFFGVIVILIGLWLRWIYPNLPVVEGHPIMADGDCYTRLHRVSLILSGQGWIWGFHEFENYPFGIVPHTTFPLDGLLALLALLLKPFLSTPLDWAGLLISPMLFLCVFLFLTLFSGSRLGKGSNRSLYENTVLFLGWALLPSLIWGTPFARPDHQSLLVVLIFFALWGEERRWRSGGEKWGIGLAILWGIGLWVSLYEPLVVLALLGGMNLLIRRHEQKWFWVVIGLLFLGSQGVEGFRFLNLPMIEQKHLSTWFHTIGETRGVGIKDFFLIFTVLILLIPYFLYRYWSKIKDSQTIIMLFGLTVILVGLTLFQRRWLYFSVIPPLLIFAAIWSLLNRGWKWGIGTFFLMNIVISTSHLKSVSDQEFPIAAEARSLAKSIQGEGGILAPWWISPSLLYFSGEPIVASSSHQSIEGIAASSEFYRGSHWGEAEKILRERKIRWVVAYDEDRVLQNASETLGLSLPPDGRETWASKLWRTQMLPTSLKLRAATGHLRLYEYLLYLPQE